MDLSQRYAKLSEYGDPLERLNAVVDWKIFFPLITKAFFKQRKSNAGRKPMNRLMMFKVLVLQQLYNLSDPQMEYQIRDRLSFIRFLGLSINDPVPDEKTIWAFREVLINAGVIEKLFDKFEKHLDKRGYGAACGTIVDASIISAPKQRNSRDDNQKIKKRIIPEAFKDNVHRMRHKDCDARWTVKRGQHYFGYKSHINVDMKHKLIRAYDVTPASTADIYAFENLLCDNQADKKVWADSAYQSEKMENRLAELGFESRLIRRYAKHVPASSELAREMARRGKLRKRVEHVFGFMENSMGRKIVRTAGIARATFKVAMMNLVYNFCRLEQIERLGVA
jgi:transposase, IS5 family